MACASTSIPTPTTVALAEMRASQDWCASVVPASRRDLLSARKSGNATVSFLAETFLRASVLVSPTIILGRSLVLSSINHVRLAGLALIALTALVEYEQNT
jgi:hypothetical protein